MKRRKIAKTTLALLLGAAIPLTQLHAQEPSGGFMSGENPTGQRFKAAWHMKVGNYATARNMLERLAKGGDGRAMAMLGDIYVKGLGVPLTPENQKLGLEWYQKSVDADCDRGMIGVGQCYWAGIGGVERSTEKAMEWYTKAADKGTEGMLAMGRAYMDVISMTVDYTKAIEWFKKASEAGDPDGLVGEADVRLRLKQYDEAMALYKQAGDKGQSQGWVEAGKMILNGLVAKPDDLDPLVYFKRAAVADNSEGAFLAGQCYSNGTNVAQDRLQGIKYYEMGVKNGSVPAMRALGEIYLNGTGLQVQSDQTARKWLEKAAALGDPQAILLLGTMLEEGRDSYPDVLEALNRYALAYAAGSPQGATRYALLARKLHRETEAQEWFQKAYSKGDATAGVELGRSYYEGLGGNPDPEKAAEIFKALADKGNDRANVMLARCYLTGRGVPKDKVRGIAILSQKAEDDQEDAIVILGSLLSGSDSRKMLEKGIAAKRPLAAYTLGHFYQEGLQGQEQDSQKAIACYEKAAAWGNVDAARQMGILYSKMTDTTPEETIKWFKMAAMGGDVSSMNLLGDIHFSGKGVKADHAVAYMWFRTAAGWDSPKGLHEAGVMLISGDGVKQDVETGTQFMLRAGKLGITVAYEELGAAYATGTSLASNPAKGKELLELAASKDNVEAMYDLGVLSYNGTLPDSDKERAVVWFQRAVDRGHVPSMVQLGYIYLQKPANNPERSKGLEFMQAAAEKGSGEALDAIGHLFETGTLVEKNRDHAIELYRKAAEAGFPAAKDSLKRLGAN